MIRVLRKILSITNKKIYLILSIIFALLVPVLYYKFYSMLIAQIQSNIIHHTVTYKFMIISVFEVVGFLSICQTLHVLSAYSLARFLSNLRENLKIYLFERLYKVDIGATDNSKIEKQFTEFPDNICYFFRVIIQNVLPSIVSLIVTVYVTMLIVPQLGLWLLLWVAIFSSAWYFYVKFLNRVYSGYSKHQAKESADVFQYIKNRMVDEVFPDSLRMNFQKFGDTVKHTNVLFSDTILHTAFYRFTFGMINGLLFGGFLYLLFFISLNEYNIITVTAHYALMIGNAKSLTSTIWDIMNNGLILFQNSGAMVALSELLFAEDRQNGFVKIDNIYEINVKDLNYDYQNTNSKFGAKKTVFNNFNLNIKRGDKFWLQGGSGSGKSTLIRIILGILPVSRGSVFINGIDMCDIDRNSLMQRVSVVTQSSMIFDGSISENIARGNVNITEDQLMEISRACYIDESGLPMDHDCGRFGERVSCGQAQMISLARSLAKTLYSNVDLIVLDEIFAGCSKKIVERMITTLNAYNDKMIIICDHVGHAAEITNCSIDLSKE